ncbi:hypothetical protein VP01_2789g2 [Puccinia sorghi]|uniref:Uncharacterized protein n=1 Tax=Puccinia sorghi TaxID=27349 RepID=A0A0L6V2N2_9BASI|nr:hypothetical protein VP01_2789g2 [Puccinia sorghi]
MACHGILKIKVLLLIPCCSFSHNVNVNSNQPTPHILHHTPRAIHQNISNKHLPKNATFSSHPNSINRNSTISTMRTMLTQTLTPGLLLKFLPFDHTHQLLKGASLSERFTRLGFSCQMSEKISCAFVSSINTINMSEDTSF